MANITRFDPIEEFFRGFFVRPVEFGSPAEPGQVKVDLREEGESYVVHAELPGVRKEDIQVSVDGPMLSIAAERRQEREVKEGERVLRTERYYGRLARSFQLGEEIDEARATARFTDGVLELTLPKKAAASAKRLTIQ